ncbi:MAG: glycosyltransferase [bacterium]|nr:glycosyltransferase [bacterium]
MNKPKISVITPVYNNEKYILESVESIKTQTFSDFEHIVIDDCSTDNTLKILNSLQNYSQLKVVKLKEHIGLPHIRNLGIKYSKGEYIVWQDADDISYPERLQKLYEFMQQNPQVGICGSNIEFFGKSSNTTYRKYYQKDKNIRKHIFKFSPISQPSAIIRKAVLKQVGVFDEKWRTAEDLELSFRIGEKYKFANINQPLLKYRLHNKSTTFKDLKNTEIRTLKIRLKYLLKRTYTFTPSDLLFNLIQVSTMFLMSPNFRIKLFNYIRNTQ